MNENSCDWNCVNMRDFVDVENNKDSFLSKFWNLEKWLQNLNNNEIFFERICFYIEDNQN